MRLSASASLLVVIAIVIVGAFACGPRRAQVAATAQPGPATVYSLNTPGLVPPKPVRPVRLSYTDEARQAQVSGDIELLVLVGADGTPQRAKVTKSLDKTYGLDEQAMFTVGKMLFEPATLNGKPVAVEGVPVSFSLRIY